MRLVRFAVLALVCLIAVPALAQSVRVGGWSLRANGELANGFQYTGSCPVDLKFGWGVLSTAPTQVTYRFERSDGGHSSNSFTADVPHANQSKALYDEWKLGANTPRFANYSGWVNLIVESPNRLEKKVGFRIHCR